MRFIKILFFIICGIHLNAQVILEHLTKRDGLPSNYTSGIIQDNDGYIWIATPSGAVRYDGKTMKTYTTEDGLTTNEVVGFFKDGIGRIWMNCFGGKPCYYYGGKVFNNRTDFRTKDINFNFQTSTDSITVVQSGITTYEKVKSIFNAYNTINLKLLRSDTLEFERRELDAYCYKYIEISTNGKVLAKNYLSSNSKIIGNIKNGKYLLLKLNNDSIFIVNIINAKIFGKYFLKDNISYFQITSKGTIVLISEDKIYNIDKNEISTFNLPYETRSIFIDSHNNYWFSTNNGVYKMKNRVENSILLRSKSIWSLKKISNKIYIGMDKKNYSTIDINQKLKISEYVEKIKGGRVLDFFSIGKLVYKCQDDGLYTLNSNSKVPVYKGYRDYSFKNVSKISESSYYFSLGVFGVMKADYNREFNSQHLYAKRTFNVLYRKNHDLIASTIDGLLIWKNDSLPYHEMKLPIENIEIINHINEDINQNLVLSSNIGLILRNNLSWFLLDKSKGLLDNHINKTFTSSDGKRLYLCTNKGFNIVNYRIENQKLIYSVKSYTTSDGLPSDEVNCALEDRDKIYLGTMEGLFTIPVGDSINPYIIPLKIDELHVNERLFDSQPNLYHHTQNSFKFKFSAFYFQRNKEMQFSYQLLPLDVYPIISDEPQINYRGLAPGDYTLKVFAFDKHYPSLIKSDVWVYKFKISPPFYKAWWFYSLLSVLAVSLVFMVYIYYMKQRQRRNLELESMLKQMAIHRLEALKGQMNPHFIFNSLNTVQHFIATHSEREAMDYIARFSALIRKMLEFARLDKVPLDKEIAFLQEYVEIEKIRYSDGFDARFDIELENEDDIELPTMLVQPLIENAIKHGVSNLKIRRGMIVIKLKLENEDYLVIAISDDGLGKKSESSFKKGHTSSALQIITDRINIYEIDGRKGKFDIQYSDGVTTATLTIPI